VHRQIEGGSSAGDDGRGFQRFWEGVIRWLVRDPALTLLRIDLDKVEYCRSQTVSVRVRTLRTDYTGASGVEVALELRPVEVSESSAPLRAVKVTSSGDGDAHVEFAGLDPGAYRLLGRATLDGHAAEERYADVTGTALLRSSRVFRRSERPFETTMGHGHGIAASSSLLGVCTA
jgi:hypothetical protein